MFIDEVFIGDILEGGTMGRATSAGSPVSRFNGAYASGLRELSGRWRRPLFSAVPWKMTRDLAGKCASMTTNSRSKRLEERVLKLGTDGSPLLKLIQQISRGIVGCMSTEYRTRVKKFATPTAFLKAVATKEDQRSILTPIGSNIAFTNDKHEKTYGAEVVGIRTVNTTPNPFRPEHSDYMFDVGRENVVVRPVRKGRKHGVASQVSGRGCMQAGRVDIVPFGLYLRFVLIMDKLEELVDILEDDEAATHTKIRTMRKKSGGTRYISCYNSRRVMEKLSELVDILSSGIPYPRATMAVKNRGFGAVTDMLWSIGLTGDSLNYVSVDIKEFFERVELFRSACIYRFYTMSYEFGSQHRGNSVYPLLTLLDIFRLVSLIPEYMYKGRDPDERTGVLSTDEYARYGRTRQGIAQGMPGSPLIADLYLHAFDRKMWKIASRILNGVYMRWVDDIVLLFPSRVGTKTAVDLLKQTINLHSPINIKLDDERIKTGRLRNNKLFWIGTGLSQNAKNTIVATQQHRRGKDWTVRLMKRVNLNSTREIWNALETVERVNAVTIAMFREHYIAKSLSVVKAEIAERPAKSTLDELESTVHDIYKVLLEMSTSYIVRSRNVYTADLVKHNKKTVAIPVACSDSVLIGLYLLLFVLYSLREAKRDGKKIKIPTTDMRTYVCISNVVSKATGAHVWVKRSRRLRGRKRKHKSRPVFTTNARKVDQ